MTDKSKRLIGEIEVVGQTYFTDAITEIANKLNELTSELGDEIKTVENLNKEIEVMKKKTKILSIVFAVVSCCLIAGIVVLYCR